MQRRQRVLASDWREARSEESECEGPGRSGRSLLRELWGEGRLGHGVSAGSRARQKMQSLKAMFYCLLAIAVWLLAREES